MVQVPRFQIGFTGTRHAKEVSDEALRALRVQLQSLNRDLSEPAVFHHGLCVGADEQAHLLVRKHFPEWEIEGHPPEDPKYEASHLRDDCNVLHPERPYLARNRNIVHSSYIVFALPRHYIEEQRSGTWSTVRFARTRQRTIIIVYPDGVVREEQGWET